MVTDQEYERIDAQDAMYELDLEYKESLGLDDTSGLKTKEAVMNNQGREELRQRAIQKAKIINALTSEVIFNKFVEAMKRRELPAHSPGNIWLISLAAAIEKDCGVMFEVYK